MSDEDISMLCIQEDDLFDDDTIQSAQQQRTETATSQNLLEDLGESSRNKERLPAGLFHALKRAKTKLAALYTSLQKSGIIIHEYFRRLMKKPHFEFRNARKTGHKSILLIH